MDEVAGKVETLVVRSCGLDEGVFRLDAPLRGYGLDSVRAVDLVVSLEEAFGISISDLEAAGMVTGRDVVDLVRRRRAVLP
ncbi:MAG: acyl carrier protein [Planctomycetes bacterium]|nr:acyl carrier protein [Planctomycetota bacterium]